MAEPLVLQGIESLTPLVGTELGVSDWLRIEQDRIDKFAEATNDHQWIHVDPERARRESPFGTTIAHGHLILSLAPYFFGQILRIESARMIVNPGNERMRIRTAVRCGDRVRMRASLKHLRMIPGGAARGTLHITFEVEGQRKPAAFGDALLVYYP